MSTTYQLLQREETMEKEHLIKGQNKGRGVRGMKGLRVDRANI